MRVNSWEWRRVSRRAFFRTSAAAGAIALVPAIAACGSRSSSSGKAAGSGSAARPVRGGTLTSSILSDADNLDYAVANDVYSKVIIANCVEPLLTVDAQGQPVGLLATSWENPDDHTYVFRLRPGVTFHDGTAFNADAVEYSIARIRSNKSSPQYPQLVYVDKLEKADPATVKLTLTAPYAPLLYNLADNAGRVISPAIGEKYGSDGLKIDLTNAGTGPFTFVEWKIGDRVTLARNEAYWGRDALGIQLPYIDKLIYRVIPDSNQALASLRGGEIDAFQLAVGVGSAPAQDIAGIKADPSLSYRDQPSLSYLSLYFNEAKPPLGSRELRQAISVAIDRAAISHAVWFDTAPPLDTLFSPAIWAYDAAYHPYLKRDLARAKQLLAQAGLPNGFAFTLLTRNDNPVWQQMAELIKDQLKEIGVDVTIQLVENPALNAALNAGRHQVGLQATAGAGLDPDSWVYPYFSSKGALNSRTRYGNPDVDKLLEQARTTLDPAARKTLYQQAQKLIVDDAAVCALCTATASALTRATVHNAPLPPTPAVGASQVWKSG